MDETELIGLVGGIFGCGLIALFMALFIAVWWKVIAKTGNSGALALLLVIPLANLGLVLFLAFSEWPLERRVKELEAAGEAPQADPS